MKLRIMALATSFVIASAAFTTGFAQRAAVSEQTFDWIFFAIVGIPFIIVLVAGVIEGKQQVTDDRTGLGETRQPWPPFTETSPTRQRVPSAAPPTQPAPRDW